MAQDDHRFEIEFFEGVHRRDPNDPEVIEILGGLYSDLGQVDNSLRMDTCLVDLQPKNPTAHYNLACSLALKRRNEEALHSLRQAVELGYRDVSWLLDDPDLKELREHPSFRTIVAELENMPQG
ncbi:tetratricopeptide repeat protein [Cerasicoccus arenae]|uniref:Tetratricopeptide repeat protein n=1 Tax=Cerasicoccus arenae TaxID=424488 RepID=A0A8J3DF00_9BACT|nr:hypothetical protein [Cerasicoccus arenae]MBK1857747.1 hypothetical protein [Cerasicoccus arenae]GHB91040.1 hypothetical protein GCM10007047_02430 [Cerasicoccus arenae]